MGIVNDDRKGRKVKQVKRYYLEIKLVGCWKILKQSRLTTWKRSWQRHHGWSRPFPAVSWSPVVEETITTLITMATKIKSWKQGEVSSRFTRQHFGGVSWQGWAGMTFWHLGTGTGMAQPIPKLWEREREWKIAFPTFGNGNGNENSIPNFWEREREWKFHSRTLGTGMRHCYSREWPGTGISSQNWVNIFCNPTLQLKGGRGGRRNCQGLLSFLWPKKG